MRDDFEELRAFLHTEGIGHRRDLREAEADPRLAEAAERALAQIVAERRARHRRRRLAGGLAVAAAAVVLAVAGGEALQRPVAPASPALPASPVPSAVQEAALAPLQVAAQPAPAGPALEELAQASADATGYLGPVPARTSWYTWEASSPQHGRLVVVTREGARIQVQTVQVGAPADGRIEVPDREPADPAVTVEHVPTAEGPVVDALHDAAAARCASARRGCEGQGSSPLGAPASLGSVALRTLDELPGTHAAGTTTDRLGRPAIGFTAELDAVQTILVLADPDSGAFLGAEWIDERAGPRVTRLVVALPDRAAGRD